jgi:hypothetical protein
MGAYRQDTKKVAKFCKVGMHTNGSFADKCRRTGYSVPLLPQQSAIILFELINTSAAQRADGKLQIFLKGQQDEKENVDNYDCGAGRDVLHG